MAVYRMAAYRMAKRLQAFFGGTFDPIHYGHLSIATALAKTVGLQRIILLPNHQPPHRPPPVASAEQRITMLKLAINGQSLFSIDDRELQRPTPSYTLHTLQALRAELGAQVPLAFIMGQDALLTLHHWYHWQQLLQYSHLLVCTRPGYPLKQLPPVLQAWLQTHQVEHPQRLHQIAHGNIYLATGPQLALSATLIRQRLQSHAACDQLLPPPVQDYIKQQALYH